MSNDYKKMTKEQLLQEMSEISKVLRAMQEEVDIKEANELNIAGKTAKDVAVRYGHVFDDKEVNWQFFIKHDGKMYDFYYGKSDGGAGDWWPTSEDDTYNCGAFNEFIPPGFGEAAENCYEFRGTINQAIKRLNKYGITDVEKGEDYI